MENKNEKKMSYEELERYCGYLGSQVNEMTEKLKQAQFSEMIARLNFEFKVLELAKYFPKDYVGKCSEDIQRVLVMENPNDETETEVQTDVQDA
jgi:hypothetical protein